MNFPDPKVVAELLKPVRFDTQRISTRDFMTMMVPAIQNVRETAAAVLRTLDHPPLSHALDVMESDVQVQAVLENCSRGQDPLYYEIQQCVELAYKVLQKESQDLFLPTKESIDALFDEEKDPEEQNPHAYYLYEIYKEVRGEKDPLRPKST